MYILPDALLSEIVKKRKWTSFEGQAKGRLISSLCQNFQSLGDFVSSLFSHLLLMLAMQSGKIYVPSSFSLWSVNTLSSMRQARAKHASSTRQACVKHAPSMRQARAKHASSTRQACVKHAPSMCQARVEHGSSMHTIFFTQEDTPNPVATFYQVHLPSGRPR